LAGETGTQGSEFPIFKSGEGAFDRAKFKEQESSMITPTGQLTGKEVDEDLRKKKKSADDVIKEANTFYNDSFEKNLKALDPAYDPKLIYYSEAYSDGGSNRNKIKKKIDDGEALDGKEIFEMSKGSAQNKIGNAQKLKTGTVTQIVENLGIKSIKDYEKYDQVKEDFDSKVKDEKLKFEPLLDKFLDIISYFNGEGGPMTDQKYKILFTPENNAIISAFAKILEAEGFGSESVLSMSKRYKENLEKLIDKSKDGSIESMKMTKEGDAVAATGPTGAATETKLAEKTSTTGPQPSSIESVANTTGSTGGTTGPAVSSTETKLEEAKNTTGTTGTTGGTTGAAVSSVETKLEETKNITGATGTVNSEPAKIDTTNRESKVNSMLKDLFGIDSGASGGTGGTGGTGDSKAKTETEKLAEKKAEDITGASKGVTGSTGGTENKEPEKKNEETKLENKIDNKNEKVNETLPVSTGKIETATQNLSSVSTTVEKPKEPEPNTATTTNTTTSNTSSNTGSSESTTTEVPKSETTNNEKKVEGNKTEGEGNKEMLDTMKTISALLVQLNSTMQGPLIVTSTNKKFQ
jgi:hypothetical protein